MARLSVCILVLAWASGAVAKPSIDSDAVLSIDSLRGPVREEQEQILLQLIADTPDSAADEKADYYFRLGELYAKQFRFWRVKTGDPQAANKAKAYLLKTVKMYKGLTDNERFRNYPRMDTALFYYGYTLQGGAYMKEARAVYDKLLKNYPNSKFVPEAHLAFADYYFAAGQLADAEARYKVVLRFPKSHVYAYALYKLAWIGLQRQRPNDALEAFYQVLVATRGDTTQASLAQAARDDFVRTYAATGTSGRTYDPLARLDKSAPVEVIELVGELAHDTGAPEREANAFETLLARNAGDPRACHWQYRVAQAALARPRATDAQKVHEIETLVHLYASQSEPDDECREQAAAMASEAAAAYQARWSKTQNLEMLRSAETLYASYVSAFPDDEEARATYAEVLWSRADRETNAKLRRRRWEHCADVFATIATLPGARSAALARMNAVDAVVPANVKVVLAKTPRRKPRELPLAPADAKLVTAIAAYAKLATVPDDELAQMRLVRALTLRRYRHFDEAATVLDELLAAHHDYPRAELAATLLLDSLIRADELDEARQVAAAMAADPSLIEAKRDLQRTITLVQARKR